MSEYINLDPAEHLNHKEIPEPTDRLVAFDDGQTAQLFEKEGDIIEWEMHKWARPETSVTGRMIVVTESGNEYIMGAGFIINRREHIAKPIHELPQGIPDLTIGKYWKVPDFGYTTKVKAVMFRYKMATEEMMKNTVGENPFTEAENLIKLAEKATRSKQA